MISARSKDRGIYLRSDNLSGIHHASVSRGSSTAGSSSSVRNERRDDASGGRDRVLAQASGIFANASSLVSRKAIYRSGLAFDQGGIAISLALSILGRALSLVGGESGDWVAGTAGIVLRNTASGSSSRVLGSDSADEGERSNSSELHVCGSVVRWNLWSIKKCSVALCIANVEVGLIS